MRMRAKNIYQSHTESNLPEPQHEDDWEDFFEFLYDLIEVIEEIVDWWQDWDGFNNFEYTQGTSLDDTIAASDASQVIVTFSGNDVIETGDGTDFVFAGVGNDTIIAGIGTNYLRGGLDNVTFVFKAGTTGTTFIRDMVSGQDKVDLSDLAIQSPDEVVVRSNGAGTFLLIDDLTIHVNLTPDQVADGDFIFV